MASGFCSYWIYLCMVVLSTNVSADTIPHYDIQHLEVPFEQAVQDCSPGVLTTLATEQEVTNIFKKVSESGFPQRKFTFWVGLKKAKDACIDPKRPLRGFKWTENGSEDSQVNRWAEEPEHTCTSLLCAALSGEFDGSKVTKWGLISDSCKRTYKFICKRRDGQTGSPEDREAGIKPATPEQEAATPELKHATSEPTKSAIPEPSKHTTQKPEPATPEPKRPTRLEPETDLKSTTGSELVGTSPGPGSGSVLGLDSCHPPSIPGARSLRVDPDNSKRIQVECWSSDELELWCRGNPVVWRLPDDSTNLTNICQRCEAGFRKHASGNCVDIDECSSSASCRHTCLNTVGSYRCVCSDENGKQHEEGLSPCTESVKIEDNISLWGILIPVLIAAAVLVVLVVVVAVTVKCCLRRRSKKRAMKEAERMAMKNKDSFATANEKTER